VTSVLAGTAMLLVVLAAVGVVALAMDLAGWEFSARRYGERAAAEGPDAVHGRGPVQAPGCPPPRGRPSSNAPFRG
jgi:hypothetical protein